MTNTKDTVLFYFQGFFLILGIRKKHNAGMRSSSGSSAPIKRREIIKVMAGLPFIGPIAFATGEQDRDSYEERVLKAAEASGSTFTSHDEKDLERLKARFPITT